MATVKPQDNAEDRPFEAEKPVEVALPKIDSDSIGEAADRVNEDLPPAEETNVVRYQGVFSERRISREEWEMAGVTGQDGAVWTRDALSQPLSNFSDEALRVLKASGEFDILRG